jgi:GntR family transcriptional repressor for pyruvate dehydrogenase complex
MFKPIKNKKVYEYVIEQIQNMVMEGELKKGDKLPSERDLSEQLGVSRTSIREAFRALEIIGLLESRQGEGNFIKGKIESSFFEPLSVMFMLNKGKAKDVLELRMAIEIEAAVLAAARINDEECQELQQLMKSLKNAQNEKESAKIDKRIHYKIAEITGNCLIMNLLNAISTLIESFIVNAREKLLEEEERRFILINQHQKVCDALIERNPDKAGEKMREHLEFINEVIEKL